MASQPLSFAQHLRRLRADAGLTQEQLAQAAGVSPHTVSDLERRIVATPQKHTVRQLADAFGLAGSARVEFEIAARGQAGSGRFAARAGAVLASRTLPRDIASFTGRRDELAELADAVATATSVVSIHAIGGMAGVGKTAFAVHAAHALAGVFPDGQIFLPLHGHMPGHEPTDPTDALASLLLTAGVAAGQIPPDLQARVALWRDRVAGRRLLLVLDDAASSEQVRPLLPGSGSSFVLVTSRRRLTALEDATRISLDALPPGEAAEMLVRLAVRPGLSTADPGVAEITRLCGCLPLAIGMIARQLYHHPAWSVADRAADLTAAADRLALLASENLSVAAAFDLSYQNLTAEHQQMFRRVACHPGTDVDAYAAAALDDTSLDAARRALEALYDHYLLTELVPGRYRLHDLIREHARALASRLDPAPDRAAASGRLLDYYQHASGRAEALLARQTRSGSAPASGTAPRSVPELADSEQALQWARDERFNLLACLDQAATAGQDARVIALSTGLAGLLRLDGPWIEAISRHTAAAQAARRIGDKAGEAGALTDLGSVQHLAGDLTGAVRALQEALSISRDLGDRPAQARALADLGITRRLGGDNDGAASHLQEALSISCELRDRRGQSRALIDLACLCLELGDYSTGSRHLREALSICRDLGDRRVQALALGFLGAAEWLTGDYPGARRDLMEALCISRDLGDRRVQVEALIDLGIVGRLTGNYPAAAEDLQEALALCRDLGYRSGQARALVNLAAARWPTGDLAGAVRYLERSLDIAKDIGDEVAMANALIYLGVTRRLTGDYAGAVAGLQQALRICRECDDLYGQAEALTYLGAVLSAAGDHPGASSHLQQALDISRDIANRDAEITALNESGILSRKCGDLADARACHEQALELARTIGSRPHEAEALAGLGRCAHAAGCPAEARTWLREALTIFDRIGAAEAAALSAELDPPPAAPELAQHSPADRAQTSPVADRSDVVTPGADFITSSTPDRLIGAD